MSAGDGRELWRAAFVIARRDFTATVFSKTFALFLLAPLFPVLFGFGFALLGSRGGETAAPPPLAVIAGPADAARLADARARLDRGGLGGALPAVRVVAPRGDPTAQAAVLLASTEDPVAAVLGMSPRPILIGPAEAVERFRAPAALLVDEANRAAALDRTGGPPRPAALALRRTAPTPAVADHRSLARGAQTVLFALSIILASMLLSNLVEEKSSKVIEVLAAAVPVRAIFLGKLFAMLAISLVGVLVWSSAAAAAGSALLPAGGVPAAPAIGWPMFTALGLAYFTTNYLLLGAVFLGLGSHASSVREVQVMSMPVTMAQLVVFGFASTAVAAPDSLVAHLAMIFPWSSPLAMLATAAQSGTGWIHLAALAWQCAWVALAITVSASLFRRNVLKSGRPARPARRSRGISAARAADPSPHSVADR